MVQYQFPAAEIDNKYQFESEISLQNEELNLTYYRVETSDRSDTKKAIVLLPDILIAPEDLLPLAQNLSDRFDVIIPLYPESDGFDKNINYSIEYRADVITEFMIQSEYHEVHLAGFGYGGLVASNVLFQKDIDQVKSVLFLNSMGIQELQFLGNYSINNALYSLLFPVVKTYRYLVPHFGYYHNQPLNEVYVRSLREKDQRDAQDWFSSIEIPSLVLHAGKDTYIPAQSATEINRLIPQSKSMFPGNIVSSIREESTEWSNYITEFLKNVESGTAPYRDQAEPDRLRLSEELFDADGVEPLKGLAMMSILILLILSAIIHEDITCISAGLLVASGIVELHVAILACFIGILTADTITYWIGRQFGRQILTSIPFKWIIKKKDIEWAQNMFEMKGAGIIFVTRFIPGTRLATYFTAGMLKTNFIKFLAYFIAAISIWAPLFVGISSLIGQPMLSYLELYQDYAILIVLVFILIIYGSFKIILPLTTVKGRREFYVKWVRLKNRYLM